MPHPWPWGLSFAAGWPSFRLLGPGLSLTHVSGPLDKCCLTSTSYLALTGKATGGTGTGPFLEPIGDPGRQGSGLSPFSDGHLGSLSAGEL